MNTATFFTPVFFLLAMSLIVLSSIAPNLFWSQLLWVGCGLLFFVLFSFLDWRFFFAQRGFIWGFYITALVLLIAAYFYAPVIRATRSWLELGGFNLQPVELLKVGLILIYATYFSRRHIEIAHWSTIVNSFLLFAIPAGLVVLQPDLGSALVLASVWFGFLLVSGLPWKRLFFLGTVALLGMILMWTFILKEYHKERILNVFYPDRNPLTYNYNVNQSKTAIGSAGWLGKGYGQGSQVQAGFLPEAPSDFIYAALVEEWGWFIGILILGAYWWMLTNILRIGKRAHQNFERFVCLGVTIMLLVQFFLNVGSVLGMSPVVGVPFPLLSYGGSSLVTIMFLLSLVHAIRIRS
ncbi:MAG: rod shape-determining protein RodA [Anaplasmataceae bacterium]|nr:rod shape-determining protein RodA [Anaplasmataceae bacterium]